MVTRGMSFDWLVNFFRPVSFKYLYPYLFISFDFSKPKVDEHADPQESLMNMMKQMYEDGDDEMKRSIRKAWYESQNKVNAPPGDF